MKTFSKDLKQHATEIMVMVPLTNKPNKSDCKQKICYICRKKILSMTMEVNYTLKYKIIVITQTNIKQLLIIFVT